MMFHHIRSNYGHIIYLESKEVVEEVMVSVLEAPKTFNTPKHDRN